jgi:hypothetical protein
MPGHLRYGIPWAVCLLFFCAVPEPADAGFIRFVGFGSHGSHPLAAEVTFESSGTTLIVKLTNISSADVLDPADVLTAVFFTVAGDPTLTRVSALMPGGEVVFAPPLPVSGVLPTTGPDVGGEWAYRDGGMPFSADEGISSAAFSIFTAPDRFRTDSNLQGPADPNGLQYGITSNPDDPTTGTPGVTGAHALIRNSVVFRLSGIPLGFDPSLPGAITDVVFKYGTSLQHPFFFGVPVVPEPASIVLLGLGGTGLATAWLRRRRRPATP